MQRPSPPRFGPRESVGATSRQATQAMVAIGAVGVLEALGCAFNELDAPGVLCQLLGYGAWVAAAILYCRWLYRAYDDVAVLDGPPLRFTSRAAVVSFFLPFVGFYRPYQVLVDLHEASDPTSVAAPAAGGAGASGWEKAFPARSWWAAWLLAPVVTTLLDNASVLTQLTKLDALSDPSVLLASAEEGGGGLMRAIAASIHVLSSTLAILVVRSVRARQRERLRRLELASSAVAT
jgi:hypothetical protein